jgi:hypothetical protein
MTPIAENIWALSYPLPLLGNDFGRNVTVIRLESGKLVIHSTGPFDAQDIQAIRQLGDPGWLLDATLFHDSFAKEGCRAFERAPYLAPAGFRDVSEVQTRALCPPPAEWEGELEVVPLAGMPKVQEHVFFHRASRTLIVCDFFFNFADSGSKWTRFFLRNIARLRNGVGMSLFFRLMIKDRAAFKESLRPVLKWDFERMVVGHGNPIERDAKRIFGEELRSRRLLPL